MGGAELKTALRQDGEARARAFWQQNETAVEERRREIETELEQLRAETGRSLQAEEAALRNKLLFAARARATECRLHAEAAMEARLQELAGGVLCELAAPDRAEVWQALRGELPDYPWTNLTVHPDDLETARQSFSSAAIACEETMGGGLVASASEGAIRIDNSLSRRLSRAWPDLLPDLLKDLRERVDHDATSRSDTTV